MQKSSIALGWKNHDCKWEHIPEVKVSPTALLWLDCSPVVFPTNIAGLRLTCKEFLDNTIFFRKSLCLCLFGLHISPEEEESYSLVESAAAHRGLFLSLQPDHCFTYVFTINLL